MTFLRTLAVASLLCAAAIGARAQQVGVILMHGKWGNPDKTIETVEFALKGAGFRAVSTEMAWSDRRAAGKGYAFDRAPANPHSAYHTAEADHQGTPAAARAIVVDWVKGLQQS